MPRQVGSVALFALVLAGAVHGQDLATLRQSLFGRPGTATPADRAWATNLATQTGNPTPRVGALQPIAGLPGVTGSRARLDDMEATRLQFATPEEAQAWARDYWKKHQEHLRSNPGAFYPQAIDVSGNTVTVLEGPGVADPAKRKKALAASRGPGRSVLRGTSDRTASDLKEGEGIEDRLADLFGVERPATAAVSTPSTARPRPNPAGGSPGGGSPGGSSPGGSSPGGSSPGGGSPGGSSPGGNDPAASPAANDPAANNPAANSPAANDPAANSPAPAEPAGPAWHELHAGITQGALQIPRAGLRNATLRAVSGVAVEPYGTIVQRDGKPFVSGRSSHFGGPSDTGVTSTETGALTGERLRSLTGYFVAMRFDYSSGGKAAWANRRLLILNPANGKAVVVRCVDWGPNKRTRRTVDMSPEAMRALGLTTDQSALVAFAAADAPLGPVRETAATPPPR